MEEERKAERKRRRFAARLKSSKGIVCIETAGLNIVVCNAGRATGFDKDSVINLINETSLEIQPPLVIAEKGETHSFLVFRSIENAVSFFNACHGKAKADKNGTLLYLNFVEKVPPTEVICPDADPKGLTLVKNFISKDEEKQLVDLFVWTEEASNLKNRQVKHYGYEFRYGTNDVDLENPLTEKIPLECDLLWKRLEEHGFHLGIPDQLTVNKYSPGHGIPTHVDKHSPFGGAILSLSLGSAVVMDWKHHSGISVPIVLPARSMLVMQGEARYDWQHGIKHSFTDPVIEYRRDQEKQKIVKIITNETKDRQTRISLTFRWTRTGPCECEYKSLCDSRMTHQTELDDSAASQLEELHVHQVYEQIAMHFSSTRHTAWPRVVHFCRGVASGAVLLDLGAGNGKNLLPRNDIFQIAGERSWSLALACAVRVRGRARERDVLRLDALHAALRDACADAVLCIAVLHHMCTKARRLQAISTIYRLLRPSGRALITVWAKDQSRSNYLSKTKIATENVQVNVNGINLPVHENRTQFQHKDLLVPWKLKTKGDKLPKSDSNSSKTDRLSNSDNKIYKSDDKLPKNNNKSPKSDNTSKSDDKSSKSDDKSSKSDNKLAESDEKDKLEDTDTTLLRFYHVFEEGELDELCREVGFEIESNFYEEGNWCVICKKVI